MEVTIRPTTEGANGASVLLKNICESPSCPDSGNARGESNDPASSQQIHCARMERTLGRSNNGCLSRPPHHEVSLPLSGRTFSGERGPTLTSSSLLSITSGLLGKMEGTTRSVLGTQNRRGRYSPSPVTSPKFFFPFAHREATKWKELTTQKQFVFPCLSISDVSRPLYSSLPRSVSMF
jgi:hypothetical protein